MNIMRTIPLLAILFLAANRAGLYAAEEPRNLALNRAAYASSSANFLDTGHMATDGHATTRWQSKPGGPQWIYVDLGADCTVTGVVLQWEAAYARRYRIQVSRDAGPSSVTGRVENWTDLFSTGNGKGGAETIVLPPSRARYVRLWCDQARATQGSDARGIGLAEFEVYGSGGPPAKAPTALRRPRMARGYFPAAGNCAAKCSSAISPPRLPRPATMTAVASRHRARHRAHVLLERRGNCDPFYGDQQFQVSDWFCRCNWWYRTEIDVPESYRGKRIWLNFDGINHKAEVLVNGAAVGNLAGAFLRGRFDITDKLVPGRKNCLAVRIRPMPRTLEPLTKQLDWRS